MFIRSAITHQNVDAVEIKYLTAFHLSDTGREKEGQELLRKTYDELTTEIRVFYKNQTGNDINVDAQVCKRYLTNKYFNNERDADSYNRYLVSYCLNNKKQDLSTGYLETKFGRRFITNMINKEYSGSGKLSPDKIDLVAQIFREATRKQYARSFQNQGDIASYLAHAFKRYFMKNYSTEITTIINTGSMTIGEGREQKDANQIKNDSIQDVKTDFDIPNFTDIVKDIYAASRCIKYSPVMLQVFDKDGNPVYTDQGKLKKQENPWGVLYYDIFSCLKFIMFTDRFKALKSNPAYKEVLYSNLGVKFEEVDINASGYLKDEDDNVSYNYRNYTSRKNLIGVFLKNLSVDYNIEFFRDAVLYNNVEGEDDKNNTKVFNKDPQYFGDNVHLFRIIRKGIKAAKAFIEMLKRRNIDPLGIPSDIFRDPAWVQRATTLREYLILYKNVASLDTIDISMPPVTVIQHNKALTKVIADESKQEIAVLNCADLKAILKNPKNIGVSEMRFDPVGEDYTRYARYRNKCRAIVNDINEKLDTLKKFTLTIEYFAEKIDYAKPYFTKPYTELTSERLKEYYELSLDIKEAQLIFNSINETGTYDWTQMTRAASFGFEGFKNVPPSSLKESQLNQVCDELNQRVLIFLKRFINNKVYTEAKYLIKEQSVGKFVNWLTMDLSAYNLSKYQNLGIKDMSPEEFESFYTSLYERAVDLVHDHELIMNFNSEVRKTKFMDWQVEPENFNNFVNDMVDYAENVGNIDLKALLVSVANIISSPQFSTSTVYESILNAIRSLSVVSFIGGKLLIMFNALAGPYTNDLVFMDTLTIAKPLLEALRESITFENIVDFDTSEVAEKFHILTRPFPNQHAGGDWLKPISTWLKFNPFVYGGKELLTCESKANTYNRFETTRKMQNGCDLADSYFRECIDFLLKDCLPVVAKEEIELHSDALLMGKHKETMLSYASYIKVYPHLTRRVTSLMNGDSSVDYMTKSLFENEYVMFEGKLLTETFEGRIYYVHKSGVAITPELEIDDRKCILPYPIVG